jgi:HAD superfamily hydrolase (TIGR01490 family)
MPGMTALALFDFDGTLTERDSLLDFIRSAVGMPKLLLGTFFLLPVLCAYTAKLMDNESAKEKVLSHFFYDWEGQQLEALGTRYAVERISQILRPGAKECLQWHCEQGHVVCVVSASPDIWLRTWTDKQGFFLISTRLQMNNGRFSGKFAGRNCHGVEKVRRIKGCFNLKNYNRIYAYGDSKGDRPMLALADEAFYKPFR